jgi:hypothetical protein
LSANLILYDRIWLKEYIESLKHQRSLLRTLEDQVTNGRRKALPEEKMNYDTVLLHIKELRESLELTEYTLQDYLNHAQDASGRLQRQLQEISLPEFW